VGSRLRLWAAPAYLFLCLVLGGSGQGIWANMLLQLFGLALIAWAVLAPSTEPLPRDRRQLFGLLLLGLAVATLQLIPLPPGVWQNLGPRGLFASGFDILGMAKPWLPISVAPYGSLSSLFALVPPVAIIASAFRLGARPAWLAIALIAGTIAGILLGILQVSASDPETSGWYLYQETNRGVATGFFANANHMASLLVIALPFLAAVFAASRAREGKKPRHSAVVALVPAAALVVAGGLALNGSLAGYGLAVPVVVASAMIVMPGRSRSTRWLAPTAAILFIAAIAWLATTPLSNAATLRTNATTSVQSRAEILATSAKATGEFLPFGSGVGSFREVYALYEDHDRLDPTTYVNHAHNDYLELALETGLPGVLLIALFLIWWAKAALRAWRPSNLDPYARAAAIASAALLVHSIVDYPLRTAAMSVCFAMCLALLARRQPPPAPEKSQLWATRHVVID
jgi:O-antigen ligase